MLHLALVSELCKGRLYIAWGVVLQIDGSSANSIVLQNSVQFHHCSASHDLLVKIMSGFIQCVRVISILLYSTVS